MPTFGENFTFFTALFYAVLLTLPTTASANANGNPTSSKVRKLKFKLPGYLSNFGYLPKGHALSLTREEDVTEALKELQKFAGVEPTGEIDSATQKLLESKRCGIPDKLSKGLRSKRFIPPVWEKTELSYSVKNWPRSLGPGRVRRTVFEAFKVWSSASALEFREVRDHRTADIVLSFLGGSHGDGFDFDGADVVLAHAFFPGPNLGGDVHFDDAENWTTTYVAPPPGTARRMKGTQLFAVAVHEIGHGLGLVHSSLTESLMYPYYYSIDPSTFSLPVYDVRSIQSLYGPGKNTVPTLPPSTSTTSTTTAETTSAPHIPKEKIPAPELCSSKPTAAARIRNELFLFQGPYFWRLDSGGYSLDKIIDLHSFWLQFPQEIHSIDAIYERPEKNVIRLFAGNHYWDYNNNNPLAGNPKSLQSLGLPSTLSRVNAVFKWGYNGKTYIFSEEQYWRFDEKTEKVEPDYPRDVKIWKGVPKSVDAAFTDQKDDSYFFKDGYVYKFNGYFMRVEKGWPKKVSQTFASCYESTESRNYQTYRRAMALTSRSSASFPVKTVHFLVIISFSIFCCL